MSSVPPLEFAKANKYGEIEEILSSALSCSNKSKIKIIPFEEEDELNSIAKNFLSHNSDLSQSRKIDLLLVGASATPHSKTKVKKFLLSFGLDDDTAITSIASACDLPIFGNGNVFSAQIISDDVVVDNNVLFSTNPLWVSNISQDCQTLGSITEIGAITKRQIRELPSYNGGETFFQDVIFKKIFQDLLVSAIEHGCIYISIFEFMDGYRITSSNGVYSFNSDNVFSNKAMFEKFTKYITGTKEDIFDDIPFEMASDGNNAPLPAIMPNVSESLAHSSDNLGSDRFLINYEIDSRNIKIAVELDELSGSASFELIYKPIKNLCLFESFSFPAPKELFSKLSLITYEKVLTRDFILSELCKDLPREGMPLFIYEDIAVPDWFPFSLKYSKDWMKSTKVAQAEILVCSFSSDEAIRSISDLVMGGRPIILILSGVSALDTIKKVKALQSQNIDSQLSSSSHFSTVPTTCPYCSKTKILPVPKKISTYVEPSVFIPDSTEFIARNHCGCDKCVFGMTEILTFAETIIVTSGFLDTMGSSELYQDDEIIQKHSDSYQSPTTEKLKAVINKTVDPDDL
jgi:hypothetical protein